MNPSIDLEAAQAAFFASGGQLVMLESFTYRPLPPRKHPKPKTRTVRAAPPKALSNHAAKVRARIDRIKHLAKTMTCAEVALLLGESKGALWGVSARGGFKFHAPARKAKPAKEKPEFSQADRDMADKIIALRDAGKSRCGVTVELGIGNCRLVRLLERFDIDFPTQRGRGRGRP